MNYEDAQVILGRYLHLEGSFYKGKIISYLYIVPTARDGFEKAIAGMENNDDSTLDSLNHDYEDFKIIAVMNFEDYLLTGNLDWRRLEDVLPQ